MTKQSKTPVGSKQTKKRLSPKQIEARRQKKAVEAFLKSEAKKRAREQKAAQDKQLKQILKNVRGKGIYDPKGTKLTPYRRRKAKTVAEQWGEFLNPSEFFFIPAPKKDRKTILERATGLNMPKSKTGLFVAKGGHKRAKLKEDKKRGEFFIEKSGKTKAGPNKERIYKSITPLASVDALTSEEERLTRAAERLMPLKKGEILVFTVREDGVEGMSKYAYPNIAALLKDLDKYRKSTAGKIQFMRHIEIEKYSSVQKYVAALDARTQVTKGGRVKTRKLKSSGKFDTSRSKG